MMGKPGRRELGRRVTAGIPASSELIDAYQQERGGRLVKEPH